MLFSLLLATAAAAVPIQLPAGEPASAWTEPLALAGLVPVADGAAAAAVLTSDGGRWTIRVVTVGSGARTVVVPAPASVQAREDLAWLLASLLQPVGVRAQAPATPLPRPVVPAPPAAPPTRPASTPVVSASGAGSSSPPSSSSPVASAARVAPPVSDPPPASSSAAAASGPGATPTPAAADDAPAVSSASLPGGTSAPATMTGAVADGPPPPILEPEGEIADPPASATPSLVSPDPAPAEQVGAASGGRALTLWVEPTAGLRLLSGASASPELGLSGGVFAAGGWRVGAAGGWEQAATLVALGEGRTVGGAWLGVEGGWAGKARLSPVAGAWLGGARRRYAEAGETVGDVYTPLAGGHAGGRLVVASGVALALEGSLRCDLRATDLYAPSGTTTVASPCGGGARLGLEMSAPEIGGGRRSASSTADATESRRRSTNPARGSGHQEGT